MDKDNEMTLIITKVGIQCGFKYLPVDVSIVSIHSIESFAQICLISWLHSRLAKGWDETSADYFSCNCEVWLCQHNGRVVKVGAAKRIVTDK